MKLDIFYPNIDAKAKQVYTGRSNDLEKILKSLKSGKCLALYGERRSGKTTTLLLINDIINGTINQYFSELIDENLEHKIRNNWLNMMSGFKSIYLSLQGHESEISIGKYLCRKSKEIDLLDESYTYSDNLEDLLHAFQDNCIKSCITLVILIDEMEVLENFEQEGRIVAELCCNRVDFSSLLFIHTGSYLWKKRVSSPGSHFTNLSEHYLKQINENEMSRFLLNPLKNESLKQFTIRMSGNKPLYAQYIGEILLKQQSINHDDLSSKNILNVLLGDEGLDLKTKIKECIFDERSLCDSAKKVLCLLAHYPQSNKNWISRKLDVNKQEINQVLDDFINFGTITKNDKDEYFICGNLMQEYGRMMYPEFLTNG